MRRLACASAALALASACAPGASSSLYAAVDADRLAGAEAEPGQWMSTGRTYSEQRFSPLDQINTRNVRRLGLAWYADFDTNRGQEATPIVVDGVIYVSTAWSKVYAFNARTGEQLWLYDPKAPGERAVHVCCDVVNRGVAVWDGKVFVGVLDGRLVALDAATGEVVWETLTIDPQKPYSITGAPRVIKGKVIIGNAGADYGVRGYVSAYDVDTGEMAWRFYTVPGDPALGFENEAMAMAAETWDGEWWFLGGGGTVWDSMAYDPELDLLYIGVGNGSPWNAELRSPGDGDNLFLASIVALDPDDGSYVWHYQTTPDETWDYTATQTITVADLEIDGAMRRVVMQAPKNGFFYVLDAATGDVISAETIVDINWAFGIDENGRPIENPAARFDRTGVGLIVSPGPGGAHSWNPMAFSPETGLAYIPATDSTFPYVTDENFAISTVAFNAGVDFGQAATDVGQAPGQIQGKDEGFLLAWDPVAQEEVWRVSFGKRRAGGALATGGGLVFVGDTRNNALVAYRATNGEALWSADVQTGITAGAVSFELDGVQHIAVVAGVNLNDYYARNNSRLLVYKLGGKAELPEPTPGPAPRVLDPPPATVVSTEVFARGLEVYARTCSPCHGDGGQSRGVFPDLRYSGALKDAELFNAVVIEGVLSANGMASFAAELDAEDADAVRQYVIVRANEALGGAAPLAPAEAEAVEVEVEP
jgi:PQQ-dependent dehydrogenase (methanol/ethanol family)